jgi:hypothetical protein
LGGCGGGGGFFYVKDLGLLKNGKVGFSLIIFFFLLLDEFTMSEDNNEPGIF